MPRRGDQTRPIRTAIVAAGLALTGALALAGTGCGGDGDTADAEESGRATPMTATVPPTTARPSTTTSSTTSTTTAPPERGHSAKVNGLGFGDCLEALPADGVVSVQTVPCDQPHTVEWVGAFRLPAPGGDFTAGCTSKFTDRTGGAPAAPYEITYVEIIRTSVVGESLDSVQCFAATAEPTVGAIAAG